MMIYDPAVDAWSMGPSMNIPRDHIMETVIALRGGRCLYVAGGRTHIRDVGAEKMHPAYFGNTNAVEIFDSSTGLWTVMRNLLNVKDAVSITRYYRYGKDKEPNLLLVGGQSYSYMTGQVFNLVEEYDVEKDLYYCHKPLAHPYFGGTIGIHEGKVHIVGGGEWVGFAASRRVQTYSIEKAPPPRQCFYKQVPIFDEWDERTWNKNKPYPDIDDRTSHDALSFMSTQL